MDKALYERLNKIDRDMDLVRMAVKFDQVLKPSEVTEIWNDAFLTNVVVPVLEHVKTIYRGMETDFLTKIGDRQQTENKGEQHVVTST